MITTGNRVRYRYYNKPEGRFYGPTYTGTVMEFLPKEHLGDDPNLFKRYKVQPDNPALRPVWLYRREIKRKIK